VATDSKRVSAPMMMLGFGGAANDKNCWKMNLLPFPDMIRKRADIIKHACVCPLLMPPFNLNQRNVLGM